MLGSRPILRSTAFLLAGQLLFISCASSTLIESIPPGAKLYVDGQAVGNTPYTHRDSKIISSTTSIRMEKEGYKPFYYDISKDEEVKIVPAVAGFFLWVPWLWAMGYKSVHTWELIPDTPEPVQTKAAPSVQPAAPAPAPSESLSLPQPEHESASKVQKLRDLKRLLDEGVLTQEEFELEKKKILESEDW